MFKSKILLSIILLPAIILVSCGGEETIEEKPIPVKVMKVEGSGNNSGSRYSAIIKPDVQVDLAFKVNGYVETILHFKGADGRMRTVQEGDFIRKGTSLARIRDNEYQDVVNEALAVFNQSKADYNRATQLYENKTISKSEYDAAFAKFSSSQSRYNQALSNLKDCSLIAPIDGYILNKKIEVGTLVGPGTEGFVIADTRAVKITFGVPDIAVKNIQMGSDQVVFVDAVPGTEFKGKITRISPSADPNSRVFEVDCTIPNKENILKVGMIAAINLDSDLSVTSKISVPINAVVRYKNEQNSYAVYVVENTGGKQIARIRKIKIGEIVGNSAMVAEGLNGGEEIIISGISIVHDSQFVKIIL
jgi:multidrug efflux system membrane fusion protein